MKPLFTIHAGEYLVGSHIERTFPRWGLWVPSKDIGLDMLVTNPLNRKSASLQVKYSKDFTPTHPSRLGGLFAAGWWKLDANKIRNSKADFWVFVLPSFAEKHISFIILPPAELLRRFNAIHGLHIQRIDSFLRVTQGRRCWEARGLTLADERLIANDRFSDGKRDFTEFLNAWNQIEARLQ